MSTVYTKLLNVQSKLIATKSQFNKFGGYYYRSCEDILEALKLLLAKENATLFISDDIVNIADRYYVKATVTFVDIESGETVSNTAFAREEEVKKGCDSSQITGASSSYARKYALNGLFAIDDNKDSDFTNDGKPLMCSDKQLSEMKSLGVVEDSTCKFYGVKTLKDLTSEQADFVIRKKMEKLNKGE